MGRSLSRLRGLPAFAAVLACAGCLGLASRRNPPASPVRSAASEPAASPAPQPAPPLQLSGPAPPTAALNPGGPNNRPAAVLDPPPPAAGSGPSAGQAPPPQPDVSKSLRDLYQLARQRYATVDGYVVRLKRREAVGGKL